VSQGSNDVVVQEPVNRDAALAVVLVWPKTLIMHLTTTAGTSLARHAARFVLCSTLRRLDFVAPSSTGGTEGTPADT